MVIVLSIVVATVITIYQSKEKGWADWALQAELALYGVILLHEYFFYKLSIVKVF